MIIACWSVKGGVGTTVVAAGTALAHVAHVPPIGHRAAGAHGGPAARGTTGCAPTLLVDLAGDLPYCLGIVEPASPGIAEWSNAGPDVPADALARLAVPVVDGLGLIPRGSGPLDASRADLLVQLLGATGRTVVVDCGTLGASMSSSDGVSAVRGRVAEGGGVVGGGNDQGLDDLAAVVAAQAERSLLVTRLCALGLRRASRLPLKPSGIVVVREAGRAITPEVAAELVGAPVIADLAIDPAVARAVDAGLFSARLPRRFSTAVGAVAA